MAPKNVPVRIDGADNLDRAYRSGWADGEQWVSDHFWDYALRRSRLGRWLWLVRARIRSRRLPPPTWIGDRDAPSTSRGGPT